MHPAYQRFLAVGSADRIVDALSDQQHLRPHQSAAQAVQAVVDRLEICSEAASQALQTLQIQQSQAIGRLRRTELIQLGRTVHRLWRQSVVPATGESQPV
jgi:hypothetical protein